MREPKEIPGVDSLQVQKYVKSHEEHSLHGTRTAGTIGREPAFRIGSNVDTTDRFLPRTLQFLNGYVQACIHG